MKKTERKIKIKFEKIVKNEDINYDNYFKIVYSSKVVLNNQNINFRYTEEEGIGITFEIKENEIFKEVKPFDKFEYRFLTDLFNQSPIDFDNISEGEEIELIFDYYQDDGIIEF
jgi:hypothetical protein